MMLGTNAIGHVAIAGPSGLQTNYSYRLVADGTSFSLSGRSISGDVSHVTIVVEVPRIRKAPPKLSGIRRAAGTLYNARIRK